MDLKFLNNFPIFLTHFKLNVIFANILNHMYKDYKYFSTFILKNKLVLLNHVLHDCLYFLIHKKNLFVNIKVFYLLKLII